MSEYQIGFFAAYYSNTALAHGPGIRFYVVLCTVIEGLLFPPNVAPLPKLLAVVIKSNYSIETACCVTKNDFCPPC